jgi:hypothetical protein
MAKDHHLGPCKYTGRSRTPFRPQREIAGSIRIRDDAVWLDAEIYDPVSQTVRAQHLVVGSQGPRWYPVRLRFAYPPELDLMAQLGGLRLRERWNNWKREPYTATALQLSVYERGD